MTTSSLRTPIIVFAVVEALLLAVVLARGLA